MWIFCCLDAIIVGARFIPVFTELLISCVQKLVQEKQFDNNRDKGI